ncbi:MAG TPA: MraY family glycosyltransferase [Planctomycetota bacterium]|nr:MraY family glycosyltransferase [Planctomycetota bacterium]
MWTAGLLLLVTAFASSLALTLVVRGLAPRFDFLDRPRDRKAHVEPVPYGGGIAIFLTVSAALAAGIVTVLWCQLRGRPFWMSEGIYTAVAVHLPGARAKLPQLGAVLFGGLVIFFLGLIDDRKPLGPWVKLIVQLTVAVGLTAAGIRVTLFLQSELLGAALTVVWIVVITNAFNFLDNMDGLSAGVALIVAMVFLVVAVESGQLFIAAALLPFVAALAGFLPFNYAPASIFMGDAGSLFIGYFLAVLSVLFTFYSGPTASFRPFALPLIIFAVPLYDAVSVTVIRLREGRSPLSGDRRHLSHRLVELGLTERLAVTAIHLLTLGIGLSAVVLTLVTGAFGEVITIVQTLVLLSLVVVLERAIRS